MPIVPMTPDSLDYCSVIMSLEIHNVNSPAVFFFFKIVLAYLGSFYSLINYRISLLTFTEKPARILSEIGLNLVGS